MKGEEGDRGDASLRPKRPGGANPHVREGRSYWSNHGVKEQIFFEVCSLSGGGAERGSGQWEREDTIIQSKGRGNSGNESVLLTLTVLRTEHETA